MEIRSATHPDLFVLVITVLLNSANELSSTQRVIRHSHSDVYVGAAPVLLRNSCARGGSAHFSGRSGYSTSLPSLAAWSGEADRSCYWRWRRRHAGRRGRKRPRGPQNADHSIRGSSP